MEERLPMKLLPLASLPLLLWLAGCATAPTQEPAPISSSAPAPAPVAAREPGTGPALTPIVPAGELKPITAAQASSQAVAMLQPPADLWERIRRGFRMNNLEGDLVRQQEQWYLGRPDYIQRMTERSSKYLFHIVEELERRDMPTELALLPFIESAFNPQAVSSARAAGMWQFMPATGRDFELKQNVFRDDRRDVLASTRAALDYLQKLYGMFGDWHLALAAYNWGEGSVSRAIARNQRMGLPTAYGDLNMPNETRNYVPKLQAVKNIVANAEAMRADLPVIGNHPYFDTVTVTRDMDVKLAAKLADVSLEDFRALNPSMNRPLILAKGTPEILLPWDNAAVFKRNFEAYNAGQYASWTAWSVPATMSASEAARRVGMNEADLRSMNSIPPRMVIKAGSVLIVPRSGKEQADVDERLADNAQLNLAPEIVNRKTMVKAGRKETVATIAHRYKVHPKQVAEWNDVSPTASFKSGQQVVVYLPMKTGARATPRASAKGPARAASKRPAHPSGRRPAKSTAKPSAKAR
jgi:membrane-bound lytic murein transglycosylase D